MRCFIIFVIAFFSANLATAEKRAFIVGVGDYQNISDLKKTKTDADGYAEVFEHELGFTVTKHHDLTFEAFNFEFGLFLDSLSAGDEVAVVFSGHGWSDGAENYLLPSDAPNATSEYQLKSSSFALSKSLLAEIDRKNPQAVLAIIDACRDDPFTGLFKSGGRGGLVPLPVQQGFLVVYAAGAGQKALDRLSDDDPSPYSVFTRNFLPLLADAEKPVQDMAREVKIRVFKAASSVHHFQSPSYLDELLQDYCFSGRCRETTERSIDLDNAEEVEAWQNVIATPEDDTVRDYLVDYPDGKFSAEANALLSLLKSSSGGVLPKRPTRPEEWPSVGLLRTVSDDAIYQMCSVTFLSSRWGVTTASCLGAIREGPDGYRGVYDRGTVEVVIPSVLGDVGATVARHGVRRIEVHPNYFDQTNELAGIGYDIALVELTTDWSGEISRLPRFPETSALPAPRAQIVGVGFASLENLEDVTSFDDPSYRLGLEPETKQLVYGGTKLPQITTVLKDDIEQCFADTPFLRGLNELAANELKNQYICARSSDIGAGFCFGDGGAPVWHENADGSYRFIALAAYGDGCFKANGAELLVNVMYFSEWVVSVIGADVLFGWSGQP